MQQTIGIRPNRVPQSGGAALALYQKTTSFAAARGSVWPMKIDMASSCDWLFSGAKVDVRKSLLQRTLQHSSEFSSYDAHGLIPLLDLAPTSTFAEVRRAPMTGDNGGRTRELSLFEPMISIVSQVSFISIIINYLKPMHLPQVGRHCRGRLPVNLALNSEAKAFFSINPDLQCSIESSKLVSPLLASDMVHAPLTFVSCEARSWHYKNISHVLLHNDDDGGVSADDCRSIAAKLAASPSFRLLITTAPLPFQHHLVHIGDRELCGDTQEGPSAVRSVCSAAGRLGKGNIVAWDPKVRSQSEKGISCQISSRRSEPSASSPSPSSHEAKQWPETGRRVFLYSTSYEAAPTGTLAELYCVSGVCCLPSQQAWNRKVGCSNLPLSLPPLAAHLYDYDS